MKYFIIAVFISIQSFAQESANGENWWNEHYISTTTLGVNGNYDSRFGNEGESKIQKGIAVEINSLHGFFLFKYFSLSAGLGLDWNFNRTFWSLPILGDLRFYFNEFGYKNSPFVFLQMGKNIKINDVFVEGRPVKIGAGITIDQGEDKQYILELFKKYKEAVFIDEKGYYDVSSFGASFGFKF